MTRLSCSSRVADVAALLGDAGLLVADPSKGGDALTDLLLGRQPEAEPQPRFRGLAVDRPFRAWIEGDPGFQRRLHQLSHIDAVGQFQPEKDTALWPPRLDRSAELALDRCAASIEAAEKAPSGRGRRRSATTWAQYTSTTW